MNPIIQSLFDRKSVRAFEDRPIPEEERNLILDAAIQSPTAGNQALFTILDIRDQGIKDELAVSCDSQPFIATAPMVLVFLADTRRWLDCYELAGVAYRKPEVGDLVIACEDALIAAQNAVVAAQSLGLGSCYIGDILENREGVVRLLSLDDYVFPVTMLVFGYPTAQQSQRPKPKRFGRDYLVQRDTYSRLPEAELRAMFNDVHPGHDFDQFMAAFCKRKYMSGFAVELSRSVRAYLEPFLHK